MPTVFLSYRRDDSPDSVKLIYHGLAKRLRTWDVFYDHASIAAGEAFPERLREKVCTSDIVLVIIGQRWLHLLTQRARQSEVDHVQREIKLALAAGRIVIPVLVNHAAMPTEVDLRPFPELLPLLERNKRDIRPDPFFETDFARLIQELEQLGSGDAVGSLLAGKYKLIQKIGSGGMGLVYLADQLEPVKRQVAVKLIKPGMDSKEILARFDAERQALALMDHPNIARVLDGGESVNGRPFFVMEYVKGKAITEFCDEKKLATRARLELFMQVCRAVQHAHQKTIIHRDLKPNNVLVEVVDGRPVPKVIDFGLAKALTQKLTDRTLFTALETRVGTWEYSSPEQAAGAFDIDTRTDIYSLGVLLYELLTGMVPFDQDLLKRVGEEEMRRVIREQDPPKPSTKLSSCNALPAIAARRGLEPLKLARSIRGELDWIVMMALEKDPSRRYESAVALADDIRRHLNLEPTRAGRPSPWYRLRKFAWKNRGAVAAAALILLSLVAGIVGTGLGLLEAQRQTGIALEETNLKQQALSAADERARAAAVAKDQAERHRQTALEALKAERLARNDAQTQASIARGNADKARREATKATEVSRFLTGLFDSADPTGLTGSLFGRDPKQGAALTALEVLEMGTKKIERDLKDQPETRAVMLRTIGGVYRSLGQYDKARALLTESLRIQKEHPADKVNLGRAWLELAWLHFMTGDELDAIQGFDRAIELVSDCPEAIDTALKAKFFKGIVLAQQSRNDAAEKLLREVLSEYSSQPNSPPYDVALANLGVAAILFQENRYLDATPFAFRALTGFKVAQGETSVATAIARVQSGYIKSCLGNYSDAKEEMLVASNLIAKNLGENHLLYAWVFGMLGEIAGKQGHLDESLDYLKTCMEVSEKSVGLDHPIVLRGVTQYCSRLADAGRIQDACAFYDHVLAFQRQRRGKIHPTIVRTLYEYSQFLRLRNRRDAAVCQLQEALWIDRACAPGSSLRSVEIRNTLASLIATSRPFEAVRLFEEARGLKTQEYLDIADVHSQSAFNHFNAAIALARLRMVDHARAEITQFRASAAYGKTFGSEASRLHRLDSWLPTLLLDEQRRAAAAIGTASSVPTGATLAPVCSFLTNPEFPPLVLADLAEWRNVLDKSEVLATTDLPCRGKAGARQRRFTLACEAGTTYVIKLDSSQFDAYLKIEDENERSLAEDDDSGGGLNARLIFSPRTTGPIVISASNYDHRFGQFRLRVEAKAGRRLVPRIAIPAVQVTGQITSTSTRDSRQRGYFYQESYRVRLYRGQQYLVKVESDAFDPCLRVQRIGQSQWIAEDVSRCPAGAELLLRPALTEDYRVVVTTMFFRQEGQFRLSVLASGAELRTDRKPLILQREEPADARDDVEAIRQRDWKIACSKFEAWLSRNPQQDNHYKHQLACLYALTGQQQKCDAVGLETLALYAKTGKLDDAYLACRMCAHAGGSAAERDHLLKIAGVLTMNQRAWMLYTAGLIHFRAKEFSAAQMLAERAIQTEKWEGEPQIYLLLSLCESRLGQDGAAKRHLELARRRFADLVPTRIHISDWLEYHLLLREAEELVHRR